MARASAPSRSTTRSTPRRRQPQRKAAGDYHHGNLRRALLDAAVMILAETGGAGFTLREAARRVGVDHRAAYRHFADREAVLAAVAEEGYLALHRQVSDELEHAGAATRGRLLAIARAYVRFAYHEPGRYRVLVGPRNYQQFPATDAAIDGAFGILTAEFSRAIAAGAIRGTDVVEIAAWYWSVMHGLADLILTRRVQVRRDLVGAFAERMVGRALDGVLRERSGPA